MDEQKLEELKRELVDTNIQVRLTGDHLEIQRIDAKEIHQSMVIIDENLLSLSASDIAIYLKEVFEK